MIDVHFWKGGMGRFWYFDISKRERGKVVKTWYDSYRLQPDLNLHGLSPRIPPKQSKAAQTSSFAAQIPQDILQTPKNIPWHHQISRIVWGVFYNRDMLWSFRWYMQFWHKQERQDFSTFPFLRPISPFLKWLRQYIFHQFRSVIDNSFVTVFFITL